MTAKYFVAPKEAVKIYPDGRRVCNLKSAEGKRAYEWNTDLMAQRQFWKCAICHHRYDGLLTFDHEAGRGLGGSHRDDRIIVDGRWQNAALCPPCNILKGSKRYHWQDGKYVPKEP